MQELIEFKFLSWFQFAMIVFVVSFLFYLISRAHFFRKQAKNRSIGFRMGLYIITIIIVVAFILVRPFYHSLLLLVIFGLFFKNIVSYTRAIFSLYYSEINFGDKIMIGDVSGTLDSMNFGGLHVLTSENRVYFPFNMWKDNKIVLESQSGTVLVSFACEDITERNESKSLNDLEKSLFNYPFLVVSDVLIEKEADAFKVAARISDSKYKGGFLDHIDKAGFRLNGNKI